MNQGSVKDQDGSGRPNSTKTMWIHGVCMITLRQSQSFGNSPFSAGLWTLQHHSHQTETETLTHTHTREIAPPLKGRRIRFLMRFLYFPITLYPLAAVAPRVMLLEMDSEALPHRTYLDHSGDFR